MDIVERLREALVDHPVYGKTVNLSLDYDDINEAADEIERLREALQPFAKIADDYETLHDEDYVSVHRHDIELRHFRAIRSALQQKESE